LLLDQQEGDQEDRTTPSEYLSIDEELEEFIREKVKGPHNFIEHRYAQRGDLPNHILFHAIIFLFLSLS